MLPKEWGPIIWYNFHILSYSYIDGEKTRYIKFFKSMPYILPCLVCTEHFRKTLQKLPPETNTINKDTMIKWLCEIHNTVNKRLHKKIISQKEAKKIYHDNNNILKVNHNKIVRFLRLVRKYISGGVSSIIFYNGSNVLVNYCHLCPCLKCRNQMKEFINNYDLKKNGLKILIKKMIDILNNCSNEDIKRSPIIISKNITKNATKKNNNIDLKKFIKNQNIYMIMVDNKLKIIIKQDGSTPGIKKMFVVKPNKKYKITTDVECGEDMKIFIWIKDLITNKVIKYDNLDDIQYNNNKSTKRISVGISLHKPKYNDIFYVKSFNIEEL